jgi:hypothetical protein
LEAFVATTVASLPLLVAKSAMPLLVVEFAQIADP